MQLLGWAVALGVGYWIMTHADQQKDFTRILGKILAWLIIVVCVLGLLANLGKHAKKHGQSACVFSQGQHMGGPGGWKHQGGWQKWNRGGCGHGEGSKEWSRVKDGHDKDDEQGDDDGHDEDEGDD